MEDERLRRKSKYLYERINSIDNKLKPIQARLSQSRKVLSLSASKKDKNNSFAVKEGPA